MVQWSRAGIARARGALAAPRTSLRGFARGQWRNKDYADSKAGFAGGAGRNRAREICVICVIPVITFPDRACARGAMECETAKRPLDRPRGVRSDDCRAPTVDDAWERAVESLPLSRRRGRARTGCTPGTLISPRTPAVASRFRSSTGEGTKIPQISQIQAHAPRAAPVATERLKSASSA